MPPSYRLLPLLLLLVTPGCCSLSMGLSALFCPPRPDPWVSISFATPEETIDTFLGAIARDDIEVIYLCLSEDFKAEKDISNVDAAIAWKMLKEEVPGIHLADQAKRKSLQIQGGTRAVAALELASNKMILRLSRQDFWSLRTQFDGDPEEHGEFIPQLGSHIAAFPMDDKSSIRVLIPGIDIRNLQTSEIVELRLGREWKVQDLQILD